MKPEKVNIGEKLSKINDYWNPRIAGELNGQHIKLVKLKGEFVWHQHENEDEMFLVVNGILKIEFREQTVTLNEGEFIVIPKGTEHRPVAKNEVSVMLFEPVSTVNTGETESEFTRKVLDKI